MRLVIYKHPLTDLDGRIWSHQEKNGWFHGFIQISDLFSAVIENEQGEIELIRFEDFRFVENPNEDV